MAMKIEKSTFGATKQGESVSCYTIYTPDLRVKLLDYGATVQSLFVKDNDGKWVDVVLGYDTIREYEDNDGYPALEMIVYGRAPLLFTKYCPLKKMGQCGICKTKSYEIKDEYGTFPIISHSDCTTTILNGKILNLLDEMPAISGVEAFRLNFTIESPEEVVKVVKTAQGKLDGKISQSLFNQETDTRGHFNKEII